MDKLHNEYKKSLIADFNSSYDRDIEHGKKLDEEEENKVKAKLTAAQIEGILSRPKEDPHKLAKEFGVTVQAIYYQRKKAKGIDPNKSRRAVRATTKVVKVANRDEKVKTHDDASQPIAPQPESFRGAMLELISMESSLVEFASKLGMKVKVKIEII